MYLLVKGIAVGFSIAAPVGAIGILCIEQTLQGGMHRGIACGLGAATADMMYGILVALGLSAVQSMLLGYKLPLMIIGGLFLSYLGIKKFFDVPSLKKIEVGNFGLLQSYVVTFLLTLTNPATILDFMALFAGLNIDMSGYVQSLSFVVGVFVGSAVWWLILCFIVGVFRAKISIRVVQYINYAAGVAILSFGMYALMQAARIWYMPIDKKLQQTQLVTTQDYIIRKATLDDEPALKNLYKKVAAIAGGLARTKDEITDAYIHKALSAGVERGLALVVENHDALLGSMIKYRLEPKIFSHILAEGSILVDPDYQGKGIGSKLISQFLQEVQDHHQDILRVEIIARESNPAIKLYEKFGFKQEGRFERRIQGVDGNLEADIPMAWINPKFDNFSLCK
jgi:threonine/homoserine/homoserine lactone efflux protein/GNAT superfamily N-acetyltransferase